MWIPCRRSSSYSVSLPPWNVSPKLKRKPCFHRHLYVCRFRVSATCSTLPFMSCRSQLTYPTQGTDRRLDPISMTAFELGPSLSSSTPFTLNIHCDGFLSSLYYYVLRLSRPLHMQSRPFQTPTTLLRRLRHILLLCYRVLVAALLILPSPQCSRSLNFFKLLSA